MRSMKPAQRFGSFGRHAFGAWRALALLAALLAIAAILQWRQVGQAEHAGVAVAIDGDTLRMGGRDLRLKGLDAPEYRQSCIAADGRDSDCGRQARRALAEILRRGPASCAESDTDRYGRPLVRCSVAGQDVGAELVRSGMAVAYGDYDGEELEARLAGRGLWAGRFERPADWRKRHPRAAEADAVP